MVGCPAAAGSDGGQKGRRREQEPWTRLAQAGDGKEDIRDGGAAAEGEVRAQRRRAGGRGETSEARPVAAVGEGVEEGAPEGLLRAEAGGFARQMADPGDEACSPGLGKDSVHRLVAEASGGAPAGLLPEPRRSEPCGDVGPSAVDPGGKGSGRDATAAGEA